MAEFCTTNIDGTKTSKYAHQLVKLAHREQGQIVIELDDVNEFNEGLVRAIVGNTKRYVSIFSAVIFELLPTYKEREVVAKDSLDVYIEHHLMMESRTRNQMEQRDERNRSPPELMKRFEVVFKPVSIEKAYAIRDIKAQHIGKFVTIRGIVTRSTEVKPIMVVATYTCDSCGTEPYQSVSAMSFMPIQKCPSDDCRINKAGGRLYLQSREYKFVKFQELKIQEHSDQVPVGHIPHSLTIMCRGGVTRQDQPGDHCCISGVFLPLVRTGLGQRLAGLLTDTFVDAHRIICINQDQEKSTKEAELTPEELEILSHEDFYERFASSLASEIYGQLRANAASSTPSPPSNSETKPMPPLKLFFRTTSTNPNCQLIVLLTFLQTRLVGVRFYEHPKAQILVVGNYLADHM